MCFSNELFHRLVQQLTSLIKVKQGWLLDSCFKVFKIVCGRAVIFHYSFWLKSWENSIKSLISAIMKSIWKSMRCKFHIMKILWYLQKPCGRNGNLMINFAWSKVHPFKNNVLTNLEILIKCVQNFAVLLLIFWHNSCGIQYILHVVTKAVKKSADLTFILLVH